MIEVYIALSLFLVVVLLTVIVRDVMRIQREHSKLDGLHRFLEGAPLPAEEECKGWDNPRD